MRGKLSAYRNSYDTQGVDVSFDAIAARIRDGKRGLDEKTRMCNILAQTDPDKYKPYKEKQLPAVTFAGTFPPKKRLAAHLSEHSGCIVLDIDGLLPSQIPDLLVAFAQHPNVLLAFISPSGMGIKLVVRVTPIPTNDAEHKTAWHACVAFFENLAEEHGFEIDPSGKDCNRMCYLAYDPTVIYTPDAHEIEWDRDAHLKAEVEREKRRVELESRDWGDTEKDKSALDAINPDSLHYDDWLRILIGCKSAGLSWQEVDAWSRRGAKHVEGDIEKRWDKLRGDVNWGTIIFIAQQNGYELPQRKCKAKLQRTDAARCEPTETIDDARAHLEEVTDTFLSDTPTEDSLHIFLVKGPTGGGKSQTTLVKARIYNKRTIGQYQHSGLAEQAVEVARQAGFQNPLHLLGREHNWDDSEIAYIPVEERTKDLFSRNNCIMADKVKEFTDKRLAPRTYCELKCPFHYEDEGDKKRNICPHLMQYEDLDQRDFISSCTPNLLFDLNMRGYLESLVSAEPDDPTDEELAIDAMMGTESGATKPFGFATIDDYTLNGLYTDIFFSASEFKAIKTAWNGSPTGDFANLMLDAFKKKKSKKIVRALRNAFETTLEHHKEIAESLTQHAHNGTVEWANPPIGSKESQRMLSEKIVRFEDDTKRFIPVDFDAYKELIEKEILCVRPQELQTEVVGEPVRIAQHPSTALMGGVELQNLTPVWAKGATPIELLGIFLKSIGNDQNAPINRTFTAGDPPIAVLSFSIPPQAPVGVIPQIAMLSPTTDPDDTKRTFEGQEDITFSEHTGGLVKWADGVQVYQYQEARLTSASIFDYPKDTDGKRKLQEKPTGLKKVAEKRLRKLNDWAKATDALTAFISYKEFTEDFAEVVSGFDIVTHFDKVAGLNFDGLKFLVVFGYPKVKHEEVMKQALKQYASDTEPLPKGDKDLRDEKGKPISEYIQLTEEVTITENGISITERRYKDPRLDKIRHQLSTEKLEQAIGRARLSVWTDTTTIIFTDVIVHGITDHATLFSSAGFKLADAHSDLPDAMGRIKEAEENGDVKAVMNTKGIKKSQAYVDSKEVRDQTKADRDARILELHNEGKSQRAIEKQMTAEGYQKVGKTTIQKVVTNSSGQLIYTNYEVENVTTSTDIDPPCVSAENASDDGKMIDEAYRLYTKGGLMPKAIAARLGESEQTIFEWLERFAF